MSYSQSTDSGVTWLALRQPESVPRTTTGSDNVQVWHDAGWYADVVADYPPDTNPVLKAWPDYSGNPTIDGTNAMWPVKVLEGQAARDALGSSLAPQVPAYSAEQLARDPELEKDSLRWWAAVNERDLALQETADVDLGAFDSTVTPNAAQDVDAKYNRFTVSITEQTEWAGQPGANLGFSSKLEIQSGFEDDGDAARLMVVTAPADQGAVLPFVQGVAPDDNIWTAESRDGFRWTDTELPVTVELLWGNGSMPVSPNITSQRLHDRQAVAVDYGTPEAAR